MSITINTLKRTTAESTRAIKANTLPATSLHPAAFAAPLLAAGCLVVAFWITFAGGETSLDLAVVTLIFVMLFGLMAGCGAYARNVEPDRAATRSFDEFLHGEVDIETGPISGRVAMWQMAAMPVILAIGATAILGCAAEARDASPALLTAQSAAPAASPSGAAAPSTVVGNGVTLRSVSVDFPDPGRMFPGGDKANAVNNNCLACHSAGMVLTQPSMSRAAWQDEVNKMRETYKAPVAEADVPAIVDYLAGLNQAQ